MGTSERVMIVAVLIVLLIVLVFCATGSIFLCCDRRRRRMERATHAMMMNRSVMELENRTGAESETNYEQYNISEEINAYNSDVNRVNVPIISPVPEYKIKRNIVGMNDDYSYASPMEEVVECRVDDVQMEEVDLNYTQAQQSASPSSVSHYNPASPLKKPADKGWDMTPIGKANINNSI